MHSIISVQIIYPKQSVSLQMLLFHCLTELRFESNHALAENAVAAAAFVVQRIVLL